MCCGPGMNYFLGCESCDSLEIYFSSCLHEAGEPGGRWGRSHRGTRGHRGSSALPGEGNGAERSVCRCV